jgi:hypothetical protein
MRDASDDTQQLGLFVVAEAHDNIRPLDAICGNPAKWMPRRGAWAAYCGGQSCIAQVRICKNPNCRRMFNRDGGGTRYCSPACRGEWHNTAALRGAIACSFCGVEHLGKNMWQLCPVHYGKLQSVRKRLAAHRVPLPMVIRLLRDSTCFNDGCGRDLLAAVRSVRGETTVNLRVDHDHRCCPGAHSCGKCVKGLLCEGCNIASGWLGDSPGRAEGLARYLAGLQTGAEF